MTEQVLNLRITGDASGGAAAANDFSSALTEMFGGMQTTSQDASTAAGQSVLGLFDSITTAASDASPQLSLPFDELAKSAEEASASTTSTFSGLWDKLSADAYNAVADLGEKVQHVGTSVADAISNPLEAAKGGIN